jgi:hypothetical protein
MNFVLGSMELALVAVTGLLRRLDISLDWNNSSGLWGILTYTRGNFAVNICEEF